MVHSLPRDGKEVLYFSVQHVERVAIELRRHLGVEHVMFATDFPHIECDWPNTRPFAERLFAGVPDRLRSSASPQRGCASRWSMLLTASICRPLFVW